jgi:hypothetical protein
MVIEAPRISLNTSFAFRLAELVTDCMLVMEYSLTAEN